MSDITKWLSFSGGVVTLIGLICAGVWYLGHADAAISTLQNAVVEMTTAANDSRHLMETMSQNMGIMQNEIVAMREQINGISQAIDIKQEFQQKEIDEIKIIEAKAIEPHA